MSRATITLDGSARDVLTGALVEKLAGETERLTGALERADREAHPDRARSAYQRIHQVGELLNELGWGTARARDAITIDAESQLPVILTALREAGDAARLNAEDARKHGSDEQARRASVCAQEIGQALRTVEAQSRPAHTRGSRSQPP